MNINAIPEIRVKSVGDEVTYELPRRNLGMLRLAGLLPLGFSALWCGGIGTFIVQLFHTLFSHPQLPAYFFCAFLFCFLILGLPPAGFGLAILFGGCRVRWSNGRLAVSERIGPFGWPRRMPRQAIQKFAVLGGTPVAGERPLPGLVSLASLSATFDNGISRKVIVGYPRAWLEAIAQDLSTRAGLAQSTPPPPVEIYQSLAKELAADLPQKPAGSHVILRRNNDSVVIEVPPIGLWKGSGGFMIFATIWCLFIGAATTAFLFGGKFELKTLPIFLIFWLVGLGMLAAGINMGKRRATFTAGHGQLTVTRSGPFGAKRFDFKRPEITNLSVAPSNVQAKNRPVPELQVHLLAGKRQGFLMGRDPEELRWIATELRTGLGIIEMVPAPASGFVGWSYSSSTQQPAGTLLGKILSLVIFGGLAAALCWHFMGGVRAPAQASHTIMTVTTSQLTNEPIAADPTLVFNTFGPAKTYRPITTWAVGLETHAEWFIPTLSGNLSEIQMAVEPTPGVRHPGKAIIFLATDKNGYPGSTVEKFSVNATETTGLLTLESVKKPALQAGVKYWLCAHSKGGWGWHFNDQNIIHNSARQVGKNTWASAGDYCYIGAFSIRVSTNQSYIQLNQPAREDDEGSTNK